MHAAKQYELVEPVSVSVVFACVCLCELCLCAYVLVHLYVCVCKCVSYIVRYYSYVFLHTDTWLYRRCHHLPSSRYVMFTCLLFITSGTQCTTIENSNVIISTSQQLSIAVSVHCVLMCFTASAFNL